MKCICCTTVFYLGCYTVCQTLVLPIISPRTRTYILRLNFSGIIIELSSEIAGGENLSFDISNLNEFYKFEGKLIANGVELVLVDDDGEQYDCISFSTNLGINENIVNPNNLTIL